MSNKARRNYIKAISQQVDRKKMYKSHKQWVVAGMSFLVAMGLGAIATGSNTHASTTNNQDGSVQRTLSNKKQNQSNNQNNKSNDVQSQASTLHKQIVANNSNVTQSSVNKSTQLDNSNNNKSHTVSGTSKSILNNGIHNNQSKSMNTRNISSSIKSNTTTLNLSTPTQQKHGWNFVQHGVNNNDFDNTNPVNSNSNKTPRISNSSVSASNISSNTSASNIRSGNSEIASDNKVDISSDKKLDATEQINPAQVGDDSSNIPDENAPKGFQQVAQGMWGTAHWNFYKNGQLNIHDGNMKTNGIPAYFKVAINGKTHNADESSSQNVNGDLVKSINIKNTVAPQNMTNLFAGNIFGLGVFNNLQAIDLSGLNTSNTTNMGHLFHGDKSLEHINFGNFDTSKVTNMTSMFTDDSKITSLNLSSFNTQNVDSYNGMFWNMPSLSSLDLSNFKIKPTADISVMFSIKPHPYDIGADPKNSIPTHIHQMVLNSSFRNLNKGATRLDNNDVGNTPSGFNWSDTTKPNKDGNYNYVDNNFKQVYTVNFYNELNKKSEGHAQYTGIKNAPFLPINNITLPSGYQLAPNAGTTANVVSGNTATINVIPNEKAQGVWGNANWYITKNGELNINNGALETNNVPTNLAKYEKDGSINRITTNSVTAPGDSSNLFSSFTNANNIDLTGMNFQGTSNLTNLLPSQIKNSDQINTGNAKWGSAHYILDGNGDLLICNGQISSNRNDASGLNWNNVKHIYTSNVSADMLYGTFKNLSQLQTLDLSNLKNVDDNGNGLDIANITQSDSNLISIKLNPSFNTNSPFQTDGGAFASDFSLKTLDLSMLGNTTSNTDLLKNDNNLSTLILGNKTRINQGIPNSNWINLSLNNPLSLTSNNLGDKQLHPGTWTRNAEIVHFMDGNNQVGSYLIQKPLNSQVNVDSSKIPTINNDNSCKQSYSLSNSNQKITINGGITNVNLTKNDTDTVNFYDGSNGDEYVSSATVNGVDGSKVNLPNAPTGYNLNGGQSQITLNGNPHAVYVSPVNNSSNYDIPVTNKKVDFKGTITLHFNGTKNNDDRTLNYDLPNSYIDTKVNDLLQDTNPGVAVPSGYINKVINSFNTSNYHYDNNLNGTSYNNIYIDANKTGSYNSSNNTYNNGNITLNFDPNTATSTVHYVVKDPSASNNGQDLAQQTFNGTNSSAQDAKNTNFDVTSANDHNIPTGYHLVNPNNNLDYDNGNHDVYIIGDKGNDIRVNYINQDGANVGTGTISGNINETGNVLNKVGIPKGYSFSGASDDGNNINGANGSNIGYKVSSNSQNMNIYVNGNPITATLHLSYNDGGNHTSDTKVLHGRVGDNMSFNSMNYEKVGYHDNQLDKDNPTWLIDTDGNTYDANPNYTFTYTAQEAGPITVHYQDEANGTVHYGQVIGNQTLNNLGLDGQLVQLGATGANDGNDVKDVLQVPNGWQLNDKVNPIILHLTRVGMVLTVGLVEGTPTPQPSPTPNKPSDSHNGGNNSNSNNNNSASASNLAKSASASASASASNTIKSINNPINNSIASNEAKNSSITSSNNSFSNSINSAKNSIASESASLSNKVKSAINSANSLAHSNNTNSSDVAKANSAANSIANSASFAVVSANKSANNTNTNASNSINSAETNEANQSANNNNRIASLENELNSINNKSANLESRSQETSNISANNNTESSNITTNNSNNSSEVPANTPFTLSSGNALNSGNSNNTTETNDNNGNSNKLPQTNEQSSYILVSAIIAMLLSLGFAGVDLERHHNK